MSRVFNLLILVFVAKVIALALWWYLPSEGEEIVQNKSYTHKYRRISVGDILSEKVDLQPTKSETKATLSISNLILKGLYGSGQSGYAIIARKSRPNDTAVIGVGESFEGYKLQKIRPSSVILEKSAKEYELFVSGEEPGKDLTKRTVAQQNDETGTYSVAKQDINYYKRQPEKVWQDISIKEIFEGKKIAGFRVTKVKKGSKMAQLGLQAGDVIIKANNEKLDSYQKVMELYSKIDTIELLALTVLRDNQEKEIIYEIH